MWCREEYTWCSGIYGTCSCFSYWKVSCLGAWCAEQFCSTSALYWRFGTHFSFSWHRETETMKIMVSGQTCQCEMWFLSKLSIRVMVLIKWYGILTDKHNRCENVINCHLSRNTKFSENLVISVCYSSHNIRLWKSVTQILENKTKRICQFASPANFLEYNFILLWFTCHRRHTAASAYPHFLKRL